MKKLAKQTLKKKKKAPLEGRFCVMFLPCALWDQQPCFTACPAANVCVGILLMLLHRFPRFFSPLLPNTRNEKQYLQVQKISKAGRTSSRERCKCEESPRSFKALWDGKGPAAAKTSCDWSKIPRRHLLPEADSSFLSNFHSSNNAEVVA